MIALALLLVAASGPSAEDNLDRVAAAWREVRTLTYSLRKVERLRDGAVVEEGVEVKLQARPLRVYAASVHPRRGQEILYDSTVDPDAFVVHPGRFPDLTLTLDLRGGLATERQHHLLSHSGFEYLLATIARERRLWQATTLGRGELFGREVIHLRLAARELAPRAPVARAGESLFDFAARVGQDAYYIYYHNPAIEELTDTLEAQSYVVPATHGARTDLAVDAATMLPVRVVVYDHRGREYERLEFRDLRVDPPLDARAFDPGNPAYDF